jgi:hypothetical protein
MIDKILTHLAEQGEDSRLRELAKSLRDEEIDWLEALSTSYYTEALLPHVTKFDAWYEKLSEAERAEKAEDCRDKLDRLSSAPQTGNRR